MRIRSIRAEYELEVTNGLTISFNIENDENDGINRIYSFDPKSPDYHLMGRLKVSDRIHDEEYAWDKSVDLSKKLRYGFLDERIEDTVFQWAKGMTKNPDGMIGGYRIDSPAVVWMCRKETFDKVAMGQSIYDIRKFQGEIIGDRKDGKHIKLLLFNHRKVQVLLDGELQAVINLRDMIGKTFIEAILAMVKTAGHV